SPFALLDRDLFERDRELLGEHARVARLERADLQRLGPRVDELIALYGHQFVVVDNDEAALAGVLHLAELRRLDPLLKGVVRGETTGERHLARLPLARKLLDHVLALLGVLLELDDVLLKLQTRDLGDVLDDDA